MTEYCWELHPLTLGRVRLVWTDGVFIERGY